MNLLQNHLRLMTFATAGLAVGFNGFAQEQERPNVIYILADDLGIGDLGCYGQEKIKTPAIDNLAANGIRFTQHYAGCTVSAPSRCSLLTGKHTGHSYIRGNKGVQGSDGNSYDYPLAADEVTLGEVFKEQGYATACVGKWGLGGPETVGSPNRQGFDYFYGYLGQGHAHKYYPTYLHENETQVTLDGTTQYAHDMIAEKALEFIENNADNPFFLYFSPTIPHAELKVPNDDCGEYVFEEVPFAGNDSYCAQEKPRATYAAMVSRLDNNIQQIVDLLEEKGIADNTLIVFSSDNGVHKEGGHTPDFFDSNSIYRGYKRDLYEGGIRTPLVMYWPAKITTPSVCDTPSAFWDFMPTVCEMIGAECPENTDGISMLPTITGEGTQEVHDYFYWEFHEQNGRRAVLKGDWKLVELKVNTLNSVYELYNIAEDPSETTAITDNEEKLEELKAILTNERTKNGVWDFAVLSIDVEDAEPLPAITSATASQNQSGQAIGKSYDGKLTSLYHSPYDDKGKTITLTYNFDPVMVKTVVYVSRTDNSTNGNFKTFELYAQPADREEYVKVGDYDFGGIPGSHRVDIPTSEPGLDKIKSLQFVVAPGEGRMVSCAEMKFYKPKAEILAFENMDVIQITSAKESACEPGREITNSYDRNFSTNYHSPFKNSASGPTVFPVTLDYFFDVANLKKVMYFTRRTERNGNFKEFEIWVSKDNTEYTQIGTYNFEGMAGEYIIDLDEEQQATAKGCTSVRFVINSGQNDMVSCSEMVLYREIIPSAVDKITNKENLSVDYYNLQGIRVADPQNGIYIKTVKYTDGSCENTKVLVRNK